MNGTVTTRTLLLTAAAVATLALAGCANSPLPPSTPSNWTGQITAIPATVPPPYKITAFTATLHFSDTATGTTVTGTAILDSSISGCIPNATSVNVTGTLDGSFNLNLTFPVGGGTGTITAPLFSSSPRATAPATFAVSGGACAQVGPSAFLLRPTPFITGTYTGTLIGTNNSTPVSVSAVMVQSAIPNVDGTFIVTANMTFTGGGCSPLLPIAGSTINGQPFTLASTSSASIGTATPVGGVTSTSVASSVTFSALNISCSAGPLSGTLNYVPGT